MLRTFLSIYFTTAFWRQQNVPSIEAVNLTKQYGAFTALSDLNLKIEGTKCVGFLGPNGAGKTTALKMFTDLIKPTKGQALINGVNVHTHKKKALESVGTLIETPEIYSSLTPRESLTMIAEIRGIPHAERKKRVEEVTAELRMEEWIDKRVGKFSKGMKQRICIASALLSDPDVVLLDEPTTGLDPRGMSEVRDLIKGLKSKNRLIFMSSHILSEVSDVCDEVAMIDHGKLIVHDTLPHVTAKFSGGNNVVEVGLVRPVDTQNVTRNIAALPDVVAAEKITDKDLKISFIGGLAVQERLLSDIIKLNIGVVSYKAASSELEDVYLKLITATL
jgi:ABC-2 type transport system ATP-binding protein